MKAILSLLKLSIVIALFAALASCQAATDSIVETKLKAEAAALNKVSPKDVTDGVRLDSVSTKGKSMRFNYTMLEYAKGDLDVPVFYKNAKDGLLIEANTNKDMSFFKEHKIQVAYAYYFKGGEPLSTIIIKAEDYK